MEENALVGCLRDLLDAYDFRNKGIAVLNQEIKMWRERFLYSLPKLEDTEKAAALWMTFLAIPSEGFKTFSPEKMMGEITRNANETK